MIETHDANDFDCMVWDAFSSCDHQIEMACMAIVMDQHFMETVL